MWYTHIYIYICIHTYMICTDTRDLYIYIYVHTYIQKDHAIHTHMPWKEEICIQAILFPTLDGLNHPSPPWVGPIDCTRIWGGENMESKTSTCVNILQSAQASSAWDEMCCIYIHTYTHTVYIHIHPLTTHTRIHPRTAHPRTLT